MNILKTLAHIFLFAGLVSMLIFRSTLVSSGWSQDFKYLGLYMSYGCIAFGVILKFVYYLLNKETVNARELILFVVLYVSAFLILNFLS